MTPDPSRIFKTGQRLLLLIGFFLIGLFCGQLIAFALTPLTGEGTRSTLLIQSLLQGVLAFFLPAWGVMRVSAAGKKSSFQLGLDRSATWKALLGVGVAYVVSLAAMNQLIYWNAGMHLPDSLRGLEASWRKMEELNGAVTAAMTSGTSWWTLISGLLVMGIVTAIAEEAFFRGAMQRILLNAGMRSWIAIWFTAVVFSLMHFQMFGFLPRVLLGAWFGYLFYWSRSLWVPIAAHALNNSLVVLFTWLSNRNLISPDFDMDGVSVSGIPWWSIASAACTALFIIFCRKWFRPANAH